MNVSTFDALRCTWTNQNNWNDNIIKKKYIKKTKMGSYSE